MSKLLGSLRPAAGAKLPQASSILSVHSPIEFGLSFTFYPTKSNPIESKAIGYPYPIRSKSIRIQVKKSNWIWIKPNPFPGLSTSDWLMVGSEMILAMKRNKMK